MLNVNLKHLIETKYENSSIFWINRVLDNLSINVTQAGIDSTQRVDKRRERPFKWTAN